MKRCKHKIEINIREEFENWIFEMIKEFELTEEIKTDIIFNYVHDEGDLEYVKKEISFLKNRYPFVQKFEIEHKKICEVYLKMDKELKQQEHDKKVLNLIPFSKKAQQS